VTRSAALVWLSLSLERLANLTTRRRAIRHQQALLALGSSAFLLSFLSRMKQVPQVVACFSDAQCSAASRPDQLSPCPLWSFGRRRSPLRCAREAGQLPTAPRITWPCVADGADADVKRPAFRRKGGKRHRRLEEHGYHRGRCHQDGK
jgi:hypothetical protein